MSGITQFPCCPLESAIVPLSLDLLSLLKHWAMWASDLKSSVRSLQSNNPVVETERAREERACVSYGLTETSPWFGPDQYTIYCHWTPETTAWSRSIKEQRLSLIINEEDYDTGAQEAKHTVCNVLFPSLSRRALLQTLLIYIRPAVFAQWL